MTALEGSLRRLQTDYIDVYFNHAVNRVERMRNEEWWEFTELAQRQGKIRYRGRSGHGSRLVDSLDYALEQDLVDVILVATLFGDYHIRYHKSGARDYKKRHVFGDPSSSSSCSCS